MTKKKIIKLLQSYRASIISGLILLLVSCFLFLSFTKNRGPGTATSSFHKSSPLSGFDFETNRQNPLQVTTKTTSNGASVNVNYLDSQVTFGIPFATKALAQKKSQTISYASSNQAIQVDYSITPHQLKEDIILKSIPASGSFTIPISLLRTEISLSPDGTPVFIDPNTKQSILRIEAPYATDAKGVVTYAAKYRLESVNKQIISYPDTKGEMTVLGPLKSLVTNSKKYNLILDVDEAWLNNPARVYPITIDPTITQSTSTQFATGQLNRLFDNGSSSSPSLESYYQELSADPNTVGLWHFNETSGNALDSSGNSNTGTPTGTTVVDGKFGKARSFNGTSDRLSIADANPLDISSTITLEAWIYPTAFGGTILVKGRNGDDQENYNFFVGSTGKLNLQYGSPTSTWQRYASTNNIVTLNAWQHVAVTYIFGVPSSARFYINGQGVSGSWAVGTGAAAVINAQPLVIGRLGSYSSDYFTGVIDEVRISKVIRTPEEIRMNAMRRPYGVYTSGVIDLTNTPTVWDTLKWTTSGVATADGETATSSATAALVAQWNFNETSGTTAVSGGSCGTDCNGALTNFASTTSQDSAAGTGWTSANRRWGAGALMFDGTDDYVVNTTPTGLPIGNSAFTSEAWINPSSHNASRDIICWGAMTSNNANCLRLGTSNTIVHYFYGNDLSISVENLTGNWHHIVVTFNGTTRSIYIDGKLRGSNSPTGVNVSSSAVYIGSRPTLGEYFAGTIDSPKIYSRALSAGEVLSNYNSSRIELQTRVGSSTDPNDGTWEEWKPSTTETVINSMDNPIDWATPSATIWTGGTQIATSAATLPIAEGTKSLKIQTGQNTSLTGAVGMWHLDETGGTGAYLKDSTGVNNGTPTGTTVIDGISSKGRSFNGSSYISVSDNNTLDLTSTFTISGWVRTTSTANGTLVSKTVAGTTGAYAVLWGSAGEVYCRTNNGTTYTDSYTAQGVLSPATGWTHITAVKNGTSCRIYINGVDQTSSAGSHPNAAANALPLIIGARTDLATEFTVGQIDEVRIDNIARSAEEVAEMYRMGQDHRVSETITSTNLSSATKLPFSIASDRLGTFSQLTVGESAFANYEPDANTLALWRLDEQAGPTAYLKDSSGNSNPATPTGTSFAQGKIGKARSFNGTSDYLSIADSNSLDQGNVFTFSAWIYPTTLASRYNVYAASNNNTAGAFWIEVGGCSGGIATVCTAINGYFLSQATNYVITANAWNYIVYTRNGTGATPHQLFVNGTQVPLALNFTNSYVDNTVSKLIGGRTTATQLFPGTIDEVRIDNVVRTAEEIRQAYEVGARTHDITIDFKAKLESGNLITGSDDLGFTVDETAYGSYTAASHLFLGDKLIVKENYDGTEYLAQGTVNSVNTSTGAVTVTAWDSGSTFPSGGYTVNATVFKWQKEYFDLTGSLSTHRDAITRLTYRITDGLLGSTVWLDDIRSSTGYLNNPTGSSILSSIGNRYFQYRAIETSNDPSITASLNSVTLNYTDIVTPAQCGFHLENNAAVIQWQDSSDNEDNFEIQKQTNDGAWTSLQTLAANTITYTDSAITVGNKYRYRIASLVAGPTYSSWCNTTDLTVGNNVVNFGNVNMEGMNLH